MRVPVSKTLRTWRLRLVEAVVRGPDRALLLDLEPVTSPTVQRVSAEDAAAALAAAALAAERAGFSTRCLPAPRGSAAAARLALYPGAVS